MALMLNGVDYIGHRLGIHEAIALDDFVATFVIFPLVGIWYGYSTWEHRSRPNPAGKIGSS